MVIPSHLQIRLNSITKRFKYSHDEMNKARKILREISKEYNLRISFNDDGTIEVSELD
jgi:hypothetical protein